MLVHRFGCRFGGAEAYVENLASVLAVRHDVTVIAFEYDSPLVLPFIPVRLPRGLPSWLRALLYARTAARLTRHGFDVVHSHMNGAAGQVHTVHVTPTHHHLRYRDNRLKRVMAKFSLRKQAYLALERARFQPGKRAVAVSGRIARQLDECGLTNSSVDVISPGVWPVTPHAATRAAVRQKLGWDDGVVVCLMVARNPLRKGLHTVLEAAYYLASHIRFVIVGADACAKRAIEDATGKWVSEDPTAKNQFISVAPTPDVSAWMQAADIFLHPTREDSFGMAPLEAMAHGLPVVISGPAHCGLSHALTHERDAFVLHNPYQADALRAAILRLVGDAELRQRLALNGRRFARSRRWETVAEAYEKVYDAVCN